MLVTLLIKFSTQSFVIRLCARYVGDVGNQFQYTTLFKRLCARYVSDVGIQVQKTTLLQEYL
jgi:hypothetical protein